MSNCNKSDQVIFTRKIADLQKLIFYVKSLYLSIVMQFWQGRVNGFVKRPSISRMFLAQQLLLDLITSFKRFRELPSRFAGMLRSIFGQILDHTFDLATTFPSRIINIGVKSHRRRSGVSLFTLDTLRFLLGRGCTRK